MEKHKKIIFISLAVAVIMIFSQSLTFSGSEKEKNLNNPLKISADVPVMKMEDINGKERSNKEFSEMVIIYSFGDRESNKGLQAAIGPAAKKVVKAFPTTKIAYINFADVVIVPNLMKYIVNPILRHINDSNTKEMKKQYSDEGIPWDESITTFVLIPEWDGDYLKAFGMKDAKDWITFIVYKDKVEAVLNAKTKDYVGDFFETFKKIVSEMNKDKKPEEKTSGRKKSGKK